MISNLLKVTSVHNTPNIIKYFDIRSTMRYNWYTLSKNKNNYPPPTIVTISILSFS